MKKFLIVIPVVFICLTGCNDKSKSNNDAGEKNLAASHEITKSIESGDVSKLGDYIATDAVDHAGMPKGDVKGLESIKSELGKMHSMAKDMKMETIKELADGEYVFEWLRGTGTSLSPEMGFPVNTKFDMNTVEVSRFKDGKVSEHWSFMQPADMMKMMPPPAMSSQSSTTTTTVTDTVHKMNQ